MLPTGLSRFVPVVLLLGTVAVPRAAAAQDVSAPPHIAIVDGQATFVHEGEAEPASANVPLVAGDTIETSAGRVEVLFADGTTIDLDERSRLDVLSPTLFRLLDGRLLLTVTGVDAPSRAARYEIDTPTATAATEGPGEYRLAALHYQDGPATELAVLRGYASLSTEVGSVALAAGERSVARDRETPSYAQAFNSARFDAFDQWTQSVHEANTTSLTARQYLPGDLQMYGSTLDRAGVWQYESAYGYVWYPRVAAAWRPYYYGRWMAYPAYGWTWIGVDAWSWPTHHYGRWGYRAGAWFWIPGPSWGPAWVAWASAPSYVAWSPLGFDGHAVFGLSIGFHQHYTSWTCVPQNRFGRGWRADRYDVGPRQRLVVTSVEARRDAPVAVPRSIGRAAAASPRRGDVTPRADVSGRAEPRRPPNAAYGAATPSQPGASAAQRAVPRGSLRAGTQVESPRTQDSSPGARDASPRTRAIPRRTPPPAANDGDTTSAPAPAWRTPRALPRARTGDASSSPQAPSPSPRWTPQVEPRRSAPAAAPSGGGGGLAAPSAPQGRSQPRAEPRGSDGSSRESSGRSSTGSSGSRSDSGNGGGGADRSTGRRARTR